MKSLVLLTVLSVLGSGKCFPDGRIINGNEATPGQFPYMVGIQVTMNGNIMTCGGSLLSHRFVLTAGHCLYQQASGIALIGAHNLAEEEDHRVRMDFTSVDYIVHEDFFPISTRNDIGLLRLPQEVAYSGYIQPVKLPRWSDGDFAGYTGTITGWGTTEQFSQIASDVLMYMNNPIYSNAQCQERFFVPSLIENQNICMSGQDRSACWGDSGGPVTVQVGADVVQIGVFSFGPASHCMDAIPIVCARTSYYLDWIQANSDVIIEA